MAHRFYVVSFGSLGTPDVVWAPVTDTAFQLDFEESLWCPKALINDVLTANRLRLRVASRHGWAWADGYGRAGVSTVRDRTPEETDLPARLIEGGARDGA
ncbi:hypothetical protein ACMA1D_27520 [Streptomyces sp. 796.1]|uniref:hypothetical protein n=1 Tax=Streptomyces sp. 796.1 TaxID=3163029 RepID=UPI0039C9DC33